MSDTRRQILVAFDVLGERSIVLGANMRVYRCIGSSRFSQLAFPLRGNDRLPGGRGGHQLGEGYLESSEVLLR